MALSEHAVDAFETIPLCGQGDEWQDEWDSIIEEVFWDTEEPNAREALSPIDTTLTQDTSDTTQKLHTTAKLKCRTASKRQKEKASRDFNGQHRAHPANALPENQPCPSVTALQPQPRPPPPPPPPFSLFPTYSHWVWFQTPQGFRSFHCSCWRYHIYHHKKMIGMPF
jgi:hypothetical protein